VLLRAGEETTVTFTLTPRQLSLIDSAGRPDVEPGTFQVTVGGKQPGFAGLADAATTQVVEGRFEVVGEAPGGMPGTTRP
jgi:beta-glucosidase